MAGDDGAEVWVKLEAANPTGSYKDRMALAMIEAAEADGRLRPGQPVVEYSGGSTGSSLAFVCAVKGYPLTVVSSDAFAVEKLRTMRAFGAEVELIPSPGGITPELIPAMIRRAGEIAAETGAFQTDQFHNADMIEGYRGLGEELADQVPGDRRVLQLRRHGGMLPRHRPRPAGRLPALHRVVVEPAESAVLSGGAPGTHHIEGGGIGARPPQLPPDDVRRGHRGARGRGVRHGARGGPGGGRLLRAVHRRQPRRRARGRPPVRPGPAGGHGAGRQRPQVPGREPVRP